MPSFSPVLANREKKSVVFSTVREARAKASTFKSHMSFGESGRGNFRVRGAFHCSEGGASTLGRCRENTAKGREVFLV